MNPVAPSLLVRPLQVDDRPIVAEALNAVLADVPYSTPFDPAAIHEQLIAMNPPSYHAVRWQQFARLAAWRARRLQGFLDAAVGFDSDSPDLPEYRPLGLLRFFHIVEQSERAPEVAQALLEAAEEFWRSAGVGQIKAFHHSTGYPHFQAGLGALPGDWSIEVRALTGAGYQFTERYYCLCRPLGHPVEETLPSAPDLSLVYGGTPTDRTYQIYRRTDWVGQARVVAINLEGAIGGHRLAKLMHMEIEPVWRGLDIGKWLIKRIINDCTMQGCSQLLAHVAHHRHVAVTLLTQVGFLEENYRGYTLAKALTA
jgi:GNAT superfamily N-acetyltransferase